MPLTEYEERMFLLWEEEVPTHAPTIIEAMEDHVMDEMRASEDLRVAAAFDAVRAVQQGQSGSPPHVERAGSGQMIITTTIEVNTRTTRRDIPVGERAGIIAEMLDSARGRSSLAAAMAEPIRTRMDYTAVGRSTFLVERLPEGALPIYGEETDE